ncbi:MAG: LuxR C-terminal-related transcriptional regulator [Calothrix sp. MO_192.B10]|nr:LuxR C-terminal-related transcriptional regulator [Calothrix sp. MO_192.B10]
MSPDLEGLIHQIGDANNEQELRFSYMDVAGELFAAQHWGISLLENHTQPATIDIQGLPDGFIDYYEKIGILIDPVMEYVWKNHAPAHEQVIFTEETWKQSQLYQSGCGKRYDHEHIMTGPIVGDGKIIGTLNFARTRGTPPFNTQDLMRLSAICNHISAKLAYLRSLNPFPKLPSLTPRELDIAELVTSGLTNKEIAARLWISQNTVKQTLKRIFRKLNVSSRTEMVAKLLSSSC